jgi:hypothetical protein
VDNSLYTSHDKANVLQSKKSILEKEKSYTFSDYFKLPHPTRDIVAEFDYQFRLEKIELPKKTNQQFST